MYDDAIYCRHVGLFFKVWGEGDSLIQNIMTSKKKKRWGGGIKFPTVENPKSERGGLRLPIHVTSINQC